MRRRAALGLAVVALTFFAPGLVLDEIPVFRDYLCTFLPFKLYPAEALRHGRFPLWIREYSFGTPFFAAYLNGVLYPPAAIVYLAPGPIGVALYLALDFWIAGYGMFRWLERRRLDAAACAFGAVAFMLGGLMISFAPWNHLAVLCWLPIALLATEDVVAAPGARTIACLATVVVMQALGGAPESFAQSVLLIGGCAVVTCRARRVGPGRVALVAVVGLLAMGICAIQLVPTIEYFGETRRLQGLDPSQALANSLDPRTLWTLLLPHRLDGGVVAPVVEGKVPLLWSLYVGILPVALAGAGAATRRGIGWAILAAASIALALGEHTRLYPFLYEAAPRLMGAFRSPQKFLFTWYFAVCVLAAIGFHGVFARARRGPWLAWSLVLLALVDLWDVHFPAQVFTPWKTLREAPPAALVGEGFGARLYHYQRGAVGLERWLPRYWQGKDLRARSVELWGELSPNLPILYGLDFVNGNDSMSVFREGDRALVELLPRLPVSAGVHLLRALGVRFLLGEAPLDDAAIEAISHGGPASLRVYRTIDPAPRIYLARRAAREPSVEAALRAMAASSFEPGRDALLLDPGAERDAPRDPAPGTIDVIEDAAESLTVDVVAAGEALLVIGDAHFPGWRADVDGSEARILRANGLLRAVVMPAGRHRLHMVYAPRSLVLGFEASLVSLVLLAGLALVLERRRARPPGGA